MEGVVGVAGNLQAPLALLCTPLRCFIGRCKRVPGRRTRSLLGVVGEGIGGVSSRVGDFVRLDGYRSRGSMLGLGGVSVTLLVSAIFRSLEDETRVGGLSCRVGVDTGRIEIFISPTGVRIVVFGLLGGSVGVAPRGKDVTLLYSFSAGERGCGVRVSSADAFCRGTGRIVAIKGLLRRGTSESVSGRVLGSRFFRLSMTGSFVRLRGNELSVIYDRGKKAGCA